MRNRLLGEVSWIALRRPDDGGGSGDSGGDGAAGNGAGDAGTGNGDGASGESGGASGEAGQAAAGAAQNGDQGQGQAGAAGAGADGSAGAGSGAGADGATGARPAADWREKELDRRARRVREETAARQQAEEENQRLRDMLERFTREGGAGAGDGTGAAGPAGGAPAGGAQPRTYTEADIDRIANERLITQKYNDDSNAAYAKGVTTYGKDKFEEAISMIGKLGGLDVAHQQMVIATDNPAKVLYELGSKPEEFQRIMELPPLKRHAEFVKIAMKPDAPIRKPSGASAPVEPIGGRGGEIDNRYSDEASAADWHAQEDKREKEHWEKRNARFR